MKGAYFWSLLHQNIVNFWGLCLKIKYLYQFNCLYLGLCSAPYVILENWGCYLHWLFRWHTPYHHNKRRERSTCSLLMKYMSFLFLFLDQCQSILVANSSPTTGISARLLILCIWQISLLQPVQLYLVVVVVAPYPCNQNIIIVWAVIVKSLSFLWYIVISILNW